jgi:uncharacterized delta-60 repeat protein
MRRARRSSVGAVALLLALVPAAGATPGQPDPYFGTGGLALSAVGPAHSSTTAVAVQSDGGIVTGGESYDGRGGHPLTLVRHLPAGPVDFGFGRGGLATAPALGLAGLAVQSDGATFAAGYREAGPRRVPVLARFTAAGALDTRFGNGGLAGGPVGEGDAIGRAVAALPGGAVVVASDARRGGMPAIALTRYTASGAADPRFGDGGTAFVPGATASAVAVDAEGRVVAAGTALDPDGASRPIAVRLRRDGALDRAFGSAGVATGRTPLAGAHADAVALAPDGSVVVAGSGRLELRSVFVALRFRPDGSPDDAFGIRGTATVAVGASDAYATGAAVDPAGRVVLAGTAPDGARVRPALVRLGPDGSVDPSFAAPAESAPFAAFDGSIDAMALDPAGRLVTAGSAFAGDRRVQAVARYEGG